MAAVVVLIVYVISVNVLLPTRSLLLSHFLALTLFHSSLHRYLALVYMYMCLAANIIKNDGLTNKT